jgi:hypothetical protein
VDLRQLGVALRDATVMPSLNGFAADVQARIARMRTPFGVRIRSYLSEFNQRLAAGIAIGAATATSAIITLMVVSHFIPDLRRIPIVTSNQIASSNPTQTEDLAHSTQNEQVARVVSMPVAAGSAASPAAGANSMAAIDDGRTPARNDVRTIIKRLEADSPDVAVWDEPRNDTTVIWVPGQP